MNSLIIEFFASNWLFILILLLFILPYIPVKFADPFGHEMSKRMSPAWPQKPWSMLKILVRNIFDVFNEFALNLGLRGSVSVVLFAVVGTDLYFNKVISTNTVIVIIVAVIALYLEYMINNAQEIEVFKVFKYKSKPAQQVPQDPPNSV